MRFAAESFVGRVLAVFSRRSPGFRPAMYPATRVRRGGGSRAAATDTAGSSANLPGGSGREADPQITAEFCYPTRARSASAYLLNEDRPDFEHVLDHGLLIVLDDEDGSGSRPTPGSSPLNAEQLRTLALAAAEQIVTSVAEEYDSYCRVRSDTRAEARDSARARDSRTFSYAAMGVADRTGDGAGFIAILAVLAPLFAGGAAIISLLIGYAMHAVSPEPTIASPLRTAGWFFAAITAASILLGAVGLLLTALRDGAGVIHDAPASLPPEVQLAREQWREALLTQGMLPFLDDALTRAATAEPLSPAPPTASRMPHLGYSRPDFSSPQDERPITPRFNSPEFSSPDWGGPDHAPD